MTYKPKILQQRGPGPNSFTCKLYQTLKEEWMSVLLKLFPKYTEKEGTRPNLHYKVNINYPSEKMVSSVQFSSAPQSCPTLCDPMNHSTPGLTVHHQLPGFTQTQVHRVGDAIQPSHPRLSPSVPAPIPSQHQSLVQWVNSSHEVAKVLEFQL